MRKGWSSDATRASLLVVGAAQFVVLTSVAMLAYPGGGRYRYDGTGYVFFENFLSDLGATQTLTGHRNTASRTLFVLALGVLGLALAWFAPTWKTLAARRGVAITAGAWAQLFAVLGGAGMVGIALTPWDHHLDLHKMLVRATFGALFAYLTCLGIVIVANGWPR